MRIAISNIAWDVATDEQVFGLMKKRGLDAVEICPTKYLPDPAHATAAESADLRRYFASSSLRVVAFQALLFGHPEMKIFDEAQSRATMLAHLTGLVRLAEQLGATRLVFGSPKNRLVPEGMSLETALQIAGEFFSEVGRQAAAAGVVMCLEPNAKEYGCNFGVTAEETAAIVAAVASPGFRLHLDAGVMTMNSENPAEVVAKHVPLLAYAHASEPKLAPVGHENVERHRAFASALKAADYKGYVSLEMLPPAGGIADLETAINFTAETYG